MTGAASSSCAVAGVLRVRRHRGGADRRRCRVVPGRRDHHARGAGRGPRCHRHQRSRSAGSAHAARYGVGRRRRAGTVRARQRRRRGATGARSSTSACATTAAPRAGNLQAATALVARRRGLRLAPVITPDLGAVPATSARSGCRTSAGPSRRTSAATSGASRSPGACSRRAVTHERRVGRARASGCSVRRHPGRRPRSCSENTESGKYFVRTVSAGVERVRPSGGVGHDAPVRARRSPTTTRSRSSSSPPTAAPRPTPSSWPRRTPTWRSCARRCATTATSGCSPTPSSTSPTSWRRRPARWCSCPPPRSRPPPPTPRCSSSSPT